MNKETLKKLPLSVPMAVAGLGTLVTLSVGRKWHIGFGILWSLLSLFHICRHKGKMKRDVAFFLPDKAESTLRLAKFLDGLELVAFVPGRLRVRHTDIVGNESLARQLESYIGSFTGVKNATANVVTGSVVIEYDPLTLRTKKGLAALEHKVMLKAR